MTNAKMNASQDTIQLVLWSFVNDESVLQLVQLARRYLFAVGCQSVSALLNAGGQNRGEITKETDGTTIGKFNVIELSGLTGDQPRTLYGRLDLSPGSKLWFATSEFLENSRPSREMRLSLETKERLLKIGQPGLSVLFLDSGLNPTADGWEKFKSALSGAFQQTDIPLDVTGFADLSSRTFPFFPGHLGPDAPRQLKNRFDRWHPMLIGSSERCGRLRDAAPEEHRSRLKLEWLRDDHAFAALIMDRNLSGDLSSTADFKCLFVDENAQPELNAELAGYLEAESVDLGGSKRFTLRGWREMSARGLLPKLPQGQVLHPIILPKYGKALGITEDEMLVEVMREALSISIQTEINDRLSLATNTNRPEVILNGHFEIYKKYLVDPLFRSELERVIRTRYPVFGTV